MFNELLVLILSLYTCVPGTLQVRYSLGGLTEPYTIDLDHRNVANGQPHSVNITRHLREIRLQVSASCNHHTRQCYTKYYMLRIRSSDYIQIQSQVCVSVTDLQQGWVSLA